MGLEFAKKTDQKGYDESFLKRMLTDWKYIIDSWKRFLDFFGIKMESWMNPVNSINGSFSKI
ncbi:hypothetical protein DQM68_09540 [Leptospira mayottensis]|uniref:Uncharacterized protein n=2 Tax=Leptospira mayottensis TaxID=1137606 RepID=A0AA87SW87_9LEPT|nr:hypothetical protein DQM68_09540 [Leptospira mayottensis]AXR64762.1 hypothetical protein DQM28_11580 [Leptospira mayottensis]AZQ02677.1 hypothetical protein LEP1GSC190_12155 [Leptospira mayottensis 200901116]EKR98878.1 hypothetical protein LEP1GSC125_2367 [Leptospira mayottensis 200901122]TGN13084.1 hypothetical protein EHR03_05930 [Leptospira mayottensis]